MAYNSNSEHTDSIGLAGVLIQSADNEWEPVAFFSRSTTSNEWNYHSYELEMPERFRHYIYGKNVTIVTYCSALKTTLQKKDFDIKIEHRSGQRMQHVHALSRAPYKAPKDSDTASMRIAKTAINQDDLLFSMQLQDENI